jgi:hypothetical protein
VIGEQADKMHAQWQVLPYQKTPYQKTCNNKYPKKPMDRSPQAKLVEIKNQKGRNK